MLSNIQKLEFILKNKLHLHKAYNSIFNTPDGELVLAHLMQGCGLLNPKITTDTNLLLVRQGQQQIVLSILRTLGKTQDQITKQIKESLANEELLET